MTSNYIRKWLNDNANMLESNAPITARELYKAMEAIDSQFYHTKGRPEIDSLKLFKR